MPRPSSDPSIEFEPFWGQPSKKGKGGKADPGDPPLGMHPWVEPFSPDRLEDVEQSVWGEPLLDPELRGSRAERAWSYAMWLRRKRRAWGGLNGWLITLLLATCCAPFAAISVMLYGQPWAAVDLLFAALLTPLVQELGKISLLWWAVEKRPYWFGSRLQIVIVTWWATAGVLVVFAAMAVAAQTVRGGEGLAGPNWWGLFAGMHFVTGTISAIGLGRIWYPCVTRGEYPRLGLGYPWFQTAFLVNAAVSVVLYFLH